jgi:hypothetical protein
VRISVFRDIRMQAKPRGSEAITLQSRRRLTMKVSMACNWRFVLPALGGGAVATDARDPCAHFAWNVTRLLALFATAAAAASAGWDKVPAPPITADRLYELSLRPQSQVIFSQAPGNQALADGAYGGLALLRISSPSLYRVSPVGTFWIDGLADGTRLASTDFAGDHGCNSLRKLVALRRRAGEVLQQLSGAPRDRVQLTVTRSPPKTCGELRRRAAGESVQ